MTVGRPRALDRQSIQRVAAELRRVRESAEITLSSMAEKLGVTKAYLSAVELAKFQAPSELVMGYERELGLRPGTLAGVFAAPASDVAPPSFEPHIKLLATIAEGFRRSRQGWKPQASDNSAVVGLDNALGFAERKLAGLPPESEVELRLYGSKDVLLTLPAGLFLPNPEGADSEMFESFAAGVRKALEEGWAVMHLIEPLGDSRSDLLHTIRQLMAFVSFPGIYLPFLVEGDSFNPMVFVPTVGSILFWQLQEGRVPDGAVLVPERRRDGVVDDVTRVLTDSLRNSASAPRKPLFRAFRFGENLPSTENLGREGAIVEIESTFGKRYYVNNRFSRLTMPPQAWEAGATQEAPPTDWLKRWEAFQSMLTQALCRDLVVKSSVEQWARTGYYVPDPGAFDKKESKAWRKAQIGALRELLGDSRKQYELGYIDDSTDEGRRVAGEIARVHWQIKETDLGSDFVVEARELESTGYSFVDIVINDDRVVFEFKRYFQSEWERSAVTDLNDIKNWLNNLDYLVEQDHSEN